MKKLIGFIGAYICYWIGDMFCKISYKFEYEFLAENYQRFMDWSEKIQNWAELERPWKEVKNKKL